MSIYNKLAIIIVPALCLLQMNCMLKKDSAPGTEKYELVTLFEKPISDNFHDTSLYLLHSNAQYKENNFTLIDRNLPLLPDIPAPDLMTIDSEGNFYISNAYENLKIFDKQGKFIYKIDYPELYYAALSPFDDQNNLFMFLKREINNTADTIVYKINASKKTKEILNKYEISQIDKSFLPPANYDEAIARKKRELEQNGIYYEVFPSPFKIKTIYENADGRFVSPKELIVYKIDDSFDFKSFVPNDRYIYDKLDIHKLSKDKVIYLNTYKSDSDGNILVSGVKSDEIERTKRKVEYNEVRDAVKAYNLIFFIWKFQRK